MAAVPVVQILHVSDLVEVCAILQHIRVISQQLLCDDPPPVVDLLEVRVRKANENLVQLNRSIELTYRMFAKVVVERFHRVRPYDRDIVAFLILTIDS